MVIVLIVLLPQPRVSSSSADAIRDDAQRGFGRAGDHPRPQQTATGAGVDASSKAPADHPQTAPSDASAAAAASDAAADATIVTGAFSRRRVVMRGGGAVMSAAVMTASRRVGVATPMLPSTSRLSGSVVQGVRCHHRASAARLLLLLLLWLDDATGRQFRF